VADFLTLSSPIFAFLELTPLCNNRCPGCGNVFVDRTKEGKSTQRAQASLSAAQWREVLKKLRPHAFSLRLTGGEPTLHPEFAEIIHLVAGMNIPFSLFTNARWSQPAQIIRLLQKTPQCTGLLISLHGPDPAGHDAFTGVPGSFHETIANIRRAVATGLTVTISIIITSLNYNRTPEMLRLIRELGAKYVVFNRFLTIHQDVPLVPTDEQLLTAVQAVDEARSKGAPVRFSVCIPQCFYPSSSNGCLAGVAYCTIDPWGNVRPCNHSLLLCGNILEKSIEEIWYGEAMQRWREMLHSDCRGCLELPRCHGGCKAMALAKGLDHDPLMRGPITEKQPSQPVKRTLFARAHPLPRFRLRPEPFGYVLVRHSQVIPVTSAAGPILDALDGTLSLQEIKDRFGQEGLNFVGMLYTKGLVELRED